MGMSDSDVKLMQAISDEFVQKVTKGDFQGLADLYTEDAVLMPPGFPALYGREEIRSWTQAYPPVTKFECHFEEVDGYDDLAYVRGRYVMEISPQGAPEPIVDKGKFLEIRRRQPDGSWPISVDTWNSDQGG